MRFINKEVIESLSKKYNVNIYYTEDIGNLDYVYMGGRDIHMFTYSS